MISRRSPACRSLPGHFARHSSSRRGTALVELAVMLPIIVTLVLGVLEVGRLLEIKQIVDNAAREGGRQASTGQLTNAQVQQVVLDYLNNMGVPTQNALVTVTDLNVPGTDAMNASQLDPFAVTVSLPFADVRWTPERLVTSSTTQVSATVIWYSMKNQSYPTGINAPPGY